LQRASLLIGEPFTFTWSLAIPRPALAGAAGNSRRLPKVGKLLVMAESTACH